MFHKTSSQTFGEKDRIEIKLTVLISVFNSSWSTPVCYTTIDLLVFHGLYPSWSSAGAIAPIRGECMDDGSHSGSGDVSKY